MSKIKIRVMSAQEGDSVLEYSTTDALSKIKTEVNKNQKWCYIDNEYVNVDSLTEKILIDADQILLTNAIAGGQDSGDFIGITVDEDDDLEITVPDTCNIFWARMSDHVITAVHKHLEEIYLNSNNIKLPEVLASLKHYENLFNYEFSFSTRVDITSNLEYDAILYFNDTDSFIIDLKASSVKKLVGLRWNIVSYIESVLEEWFEENY